MVWLEFTICAGLILYSGSRLARYADVLAEKTGMGRTWLGLILLATVTSLPELGTGISAVTVAAAPDIAVGTVLGSCVFNLMLLGAVDLLYRSAPILTRADPGHILSAGFGVLLLGIAVMGFFLDGLGVLPGLLWVGLYTPVILALYVAAMWTVFQYEKRRTQKSPGTKAEALQYEDLSKSTAYRFAALHASVVIGAGFWLPFIGVRIALETGWGHTFVGNLLMAASTSLPEIVTTLAALRLGAYDMAVANLFGSNLFNMAVLAIDDLVFLKGPLLSHVSDLHMLSAAFAIIMTSFGILGLIYRYQKKLLGILSWEGAGMLFFYLLNAGILFFLAKGLSG